MEMEGETTLAGDDRGNNVNFNYPFMCHKLPSSLVRHFMKET